AFTYDSTGRVRRMVDPDGQARLLDRSADGSVLLERGGTPGGRPRTAQGAGLVCTYDASGQLTHRRSAAGGAVLRWDDLGRLAEVVTERGQAVRFGYDALGRRVFKEVEGQRVHFRWHGEQLLADEPAEGPPREFVYWPGSFAPLAVVAGSIRHYETGP